MLSWTLNEIDKKLIQLSLREDLQEPPCDITTQTLFNNVSTIPSRRSAVIISKMNQPLVMCGVKVIDEILKNFSGCCHIDYYVQDGSKIQPQSVILKVSGDPRELLMMERVLLNYLQHLIAVATYTHRFVEKVAHTHLKILDTRKTTPGFRHLEKYAVYCGGGVNHRMGLYDAIMIKDTHIDLLGGLEAALDKLSLLTDNTVPTIVEVRNQDELGLLLQKGCGKVSRVLLDNMHYDDLKQAVKACQGSMHTEASGNITLDTVLDVAATGVEFASIGALTHSALHVDLSMREQSND